MGLIVTLTGGSGSGKSSIVEALLKDPFFKLVPSNTTRLQRPVDMPGEYTYLTNPQFDALVSSGQTLWTAGIATGSRYATLTRDLEAAVANRNYNLMVLVPERVVTVHEYARRVKAPICSFWVECPEDQRRVRMNNRAAPHEIETRIVSEIMWRQTLENYKVPYIAVSNRNGQLEHTIDAVRDIIKSRLI